MTIPFIHHNLFEINNSFNIKEEKVNNFNYLIIDNFYKNPEKIHSWFQQSWVPPWKLDARGNNFKEYYDCRMFVPLTQHGFENENKTTNFFKSLLNIKNKECVHIQTNIFTWINCPLNNDIQFRPHTDGGLNILVYLDKTCSGGTALYEYELSNLQKEEIDIRTDISDIKNNMHVIPSKFNRCVIFNGDIPHGGYIEDHQKYSNGNWRYNTLYCFEWQN